MRDKLHDTDLSDAAWAIVAPPLPPARPGGRPRTTCLRSVLDAVHYPLRTGCQRRPLPREYPPWSTVHHYSRAWQGTEIRVRLHRSLHERARLAAGRLPCPSLVIMDGQSMKTTERGGVRGFDGHELIKGGSHILVDTLGLVITCRVEPAGISDQKAGARLLGGPRPFFPLIRTVMADAGHRSRKLARALKQHEGWALVITKRGQRAFKIKGLTWIVECGFAWLGRNRRPSQDHECRVQTSETMIDVAAIRFMLNRLAPA